MDEADLADIENGRHLAAALAATRFAAKGLEVAPRGMCLNCDAGLVDVTLRWCDDDCRDDWCQRNAAQRAPRNILARDEDV